MLFRSKELREIAKKLDAEGQSALEETRKFANALKKGLNPLVEAPVDGTHRRWIRERIAEVQKELRSRGIDLENADLQAVLWYLEKELYEKLKYRSKSGESDYASAASSLYQSVVGRPSDVYAGGTGRVRAIGGDGRGDVMGGENAVKAPKPAGEVSQRFMPASPETPEFKQWFGASKVSTPDGRPLVVYHGTNVPLTTFKTNRPAWFAENPELANQFTAGGRRSMGAKPGKGSSVLPVYLRIENPLDLTSMNPGTKISRVELLNMIGADSSDAALRDLAKQQIESKFVGLASTIADPIQYMVNLYKEKTMLYQLLDDPNMVSSIRNAGFDGVSMTENVTVGKKNAPQKVDSITYAVFDPNQVKSATGNIGEFSTTNPDIRLMPSEAMMAAGRSPNDRREAVQLFEQGWKIYGSPYDGAEDPIRLKKVSEIDLYDPENMWAVPPKKLVLSGMRNMPAPDASMPGAYSFQGGFRALPGKEKGKLRIYGPAGNLIGIAASLDQAERMIQKKAGR